MRLIGLVIVLAVSCVLAPLAAEAQPTGGKVYRIGVIASSHSVADAMGPSPRNPYVAALLRGLHDLGYVYGRDIVTEVRSTEGNTERGRAVAAELAALKVDVIVAGGPALAGVKQSGIATPVVMSGSGPDPVQAGFVHSLARPGGNFTGMSLQHLELDRKRLQLLTDLVPNAALVAVLRGPDSDRNWNELQDAARLLTKDILSLKVQNAAEIEGAFRDATQRRASALIVIATGLLDLHARQVVDRAAMHRLPTIYSFRNFYMDQGGLISYGVDLVDIWRRAASYVDKIIKGAKPADLPVEQPTKFELVINLKTAKALGLTIPQTLLLQATQVIDP